MVKIIKILLGAIAGFLCLILILVKWLIIFIMTGKNMPKTNQEISDLIDIVEL